MIPSNGWGHNPISPSDYKHFLIDLEMSELTWIMPMSQVVDILARIDAEFLRIESQKQESKSSPKSRKSPEQV